MKKKLLIFTFIASLFAYSCSNQNESQNQNGETNNPKDTEQDVGEGTGVGPDRNSRSSRGIVTAPNTTNPTEADTITASEGETAPKQEGQSDQGNAADAQGTNVVK